MKQISYTAIGIIIGAITIWFAKPDTPSPTQSLPPILSLQQMSSLATLKVSYANIIESAISKKLLDRYVIGATRALLVARGDCLIGTDLSHARYGNTNSSARTIDLLLPAPTMISSSVSHAERKDGGSYFYAVNSTGIAIFTPDDKVSAVQAAYTFAQQDIESDCHRKEVIATAQKNTELALSPTFKTLGWEVRYQWDQAARQD